MRKASTAWKYGGLKKDDKGKLLRDQMYPSAPRRSSTVPLGRHADKMLKLETAEAEKQSQSKLTDFRFVKTDV